MSSSPPFVINIAVLLGSCVSCFSSDADRVTRTTPIPTPQETPNASPLNTQAAAAEAAAAKVAAARAAAAAAEAVASSVGSANRQQTSNAPPPTPAAAAPPSRTSEGAVCGVGLVLVPDRVGALVVSSVTEGGPAARTNLVRRGDVLKQIDGRDVYTWPMARVRPLIVGAAGSIVTLGMQVMRARAGPLLLLNRWRSEKAKTRSSSFASRARPSVWATSPWPTPLRRRHRRSRLKLLCTRVRPLPLRPPVSCRSSSINLLALLPLHPSFPPRAPRPQPPLSNAASAWCCLPSLVAASRFVHGFPSPARGSERCVCCC